MAQVLHRHAHLGGQQVLPPTRSDGSDALFLGVALYMSSRARFMNEHVLLACYGKELHKLARSVENAVRWSKSRISE